MKHWFLGVIILCLSLFSTQAYSTNVLVTKQQRADLEDFFHYLFAFNELGYSLFGDKPMSFCFLPTGRPHIATMDHPFKIYRRGHRSFKNGATVWKKIRNRNSNFELILHEENGIPILAILVNKQAFFKVIEQNSELFKELKIDDLFDTDYVLNNLFKNHLALGILLGYGKQNSELFQRRAEIFSHLLRVPFNGQTKPKPPFANLYEEITFLQKLLHQAPPKSSFLYLVTHVNFAADPSSEETRILKQKYSLKHKELTEIFKRSDWLDIVVKQFQES